VVQQERTPLRISVYSFLADLLLAVFVIASVAGTWIEFGAGFGLMVLGVASGLVAYLLGAD